MDTIYIRSFSRLKRALFKLHYLHAICTFIKKLLIDWQNDKVNLDFIQFVNLGLAFWLFSKDVFGWSIDITTEGNNIILGAPGYDNNTDRPGYVRVYSLVSNDEAGDDTWNQIGQDIIGEAIGDEFGYSVSISEDGETIAVGAVYGVNSNSGYVRIYRLEDDGMSWEQSGEDIDGEATYDELGHSVSLSCNIDIICVPCRIDSTYVISTLHVLRNVDITWCLFHVISTLHM